MPSSYILYINIGDGVFMKNRRKLLRKMTLAHQKLNKSAYKKYKNRISLSTKKAVIRFLLLITAELILIVLLKYILL